MHALCRFFLEQTGPGLERGSYDFIPFVIHMPTLFEAFVAEWLEENLPPTYMLEKQYIARLDAEGHFSFKIDLVLANSATGESLGVLDTKYKRTKQPEQEDYMQIVAYAESMHTTNAFLIYPSTQTKQFDFPVGKVQVRGLTFDISKDLQKAGAKFLNAILKGIN
jgi:5-methylcytosine-specific restriction enzyme subunit McrC